MVIFFNLSPRSNHLHPLQVENCDSNPRLVVDDDDNGKLRPEKVDIYSDNSAEKRNINGGPIYNSTQRGRF